MTPRAVRPAMAETAPALSPLSQSCTCFVNRSVLGKRGRAGGGGAARAERDDKKQQKRRDETAAAERGKRRRGAGDAHAGRPSAGARGGRAGDTEAHQTALHSELGMRHVPTVGGATAGMAIKRQKQKRKATRATQRPCTAIRIPIGQSEK